MKPENNIKLIKGIRVITKHTFIKPELFRLILLLTLFITGYNSVQAQEFIYIKSGNNYLALTSSGAITNENTTGTPSKYALWVKVYLSSAQTTNYQLYNVGTGRYLTEPVNSTLASTEYPFTAANAYNTNSTNNYNVWSGTTTIINSNTSYSSRNLNFNTVWVAGTATTSVHNLITPNISIRHKSGSYYSGFLSNGMQKTHTDTKIIYANGSVTLKAPPQSGSYYSAHAYFRWYMYESDGLYSTNSISFTNSKTATNGLYLLNNTTINPQTATYNFTTDNNAGRSTIVACDVSAQRDFGFDYTSSTEATLIEPSLSYRTIFIVKPATEIANQLRTISNAGNYLENEVVYMPKHNLLAVTPNPSGSNPAYQYPRVTLEMDRDNYFGYTTSGGTTLANSITNASGTGIGWTATATNGVSISSYDGRFIYLNTSGATSNSSVVTVTLRTIANGPVYNIAKFTVNLTDYGPKTFSSIEAITSESDINYKRKLSYLNKNYILISKQDFDQDSTTATSANNASRIPLGYDICSYGFASPSHYDNGFKDIHQSYVTNRVPQFNEYGLFKTANVSGVSASVGSGNVGSTWWNNGKVVRDRLYEMRGSASGKNGYFMYFDAAMDPGLIATLPIDPLCAGTTLVVSAGIASLTQSGGGNAYPNMNFVFIGVDASGNETELNRYTTGDIPVYTGSSDTPWYQLYYTFTFQQSYAGYTSYKLRLENNCNSTSGADYAVDDIRIYRSKPTVQANQITLPCGDENAKIKIRVEYTKLLASLGVTEVTTGSGTPIELKYKFLDDNKVSLTNYNYGTTASPAFDYGTIRILTKFSDMNVLAPGADAPIADRTIKEAYTETEIIDGVTYRYLVFQTPNNVVLLPNKEYFTVIANNVGVFGTDLCSMISDPFVIIPPSVITVDGATWTEEQGLCYGNTITLGAMLKDRITYENIACRFDWFIGSSAEYKSTSGGMSVEEAIKAYRVEYPIPTSGNYTLQATKGLFTTTAYNLLNSMISANKLLLNRSQITRIVRQGENFVAYPIIGTAVPTSSTPTLLLCNDFIPLGGTQTPKNPTIEWASGTMGSISVRMSLDQYNDLKNNGSKTLKIPVKDFKNSDKTKLRNLAKTSDTNVYLISTDDPNYVVDSLAPITQMATLNTINITSSLIDEDYILLSNIRNITAKEGYTYKIEFKFNQVNLNGEVSVCDGVTSLYIKIVPKYLTWKGNAGDNWNNDNNWVRSYQSDIYKNASHNSDGYADYSSPLTHKGFVPMNFSNVTIPAVNGLTVLKSPWLYSLTGSPVSTDNTNYTAEADKAANAATSGIANDVCVKSSGANYDCENYYGNTVNKIYFKPLAEMRNTNLLTYNDASVEFELTSGKWYMMTSPLKDVVAGDMYTPSSNGKQDTEAFSSITYSPTTNNRFNPAVYQHSWDKADSKIFKTDHTSTDAYISSNWSYVYNEVSEPYSPGTGFVIKPIYGTPGVSKLLFRLPKNDASYSYYSYDGNTTGDNTAITRTNNGKLALDNAAANVNLNITNQSGANDIFLVGNPMMASLDMKLFFDQNTSLERKFWIITTNGLSTAQIAADGVITTSGADVLTRNIAPMQAFFVKRADGSNTSSIALNPSMSIAASSTSQLRSADNENNSCKKLTLTANGNDFTSSTVIVKKEGAYDSYDSKEDVLLIHDENLIEKPSLFTLTGNKAVMINTVSNIDSIPLGILSKTDQEVELTFSGLENFSEKNLNLFDNKLNQSINLNSTNNKVKIKTNNFGRYSLNAGNKSTFENNSYKDIYAYSSGKGKITVNSVNYKIDNIKIYNLSGVLIRSLNNIENQSIELSLTESNLYMIKIISGDKIVYSKVYCK
jgi:hypothetical protein